MEKLKSALSCSLLFLFMILMLSVRTADQSSELDADKDRVAGSVIFGFIVSIPAILVASVMFNPIGPLTKRLGFIAIGLIGLMLLNEISKLDLGPNLSAPK